MTLSGAIFFMVVGLGCAAVAHAERANNGRPESFRVNSAVAAKVRISPAESRIDARLSPHRTGMRATRFADAARLPANGRALAGKINRFVSARTQVDVSPRPQVAVQPGTTRAPLRAAPHRR